MSSGHTTHPRSLALILHHWGQRSHMLLAAILLLQLALHPVLQHGWGARLLDLLVVAGIAMGLRAVGEAWRRVGAAAAVFGLIVVGLTFNAVWSGSGAAAQRHSNIAGAVLTAGFSLYLAVAIGGRLFHIHAVRTDDIFAALAFYLIMGTFWAHVHHVLDLTMPGSYNAPAPSAASHVQNHALACPPTRFLYFSYVTMSTVGYGDVTPKTDLARMIAVIEAVLGQFYLAVLVARLVALHLARQSHEDRHTGTSVSATPATHEQDNTSTGQ